MKGLVGAAAVLGLLGVAAPASAATYTVTYRGHVTSGFDNELFGGLGDLRDMPFTVVYTVDTAKPAAFLFNGDGTSQLFGDGFEGPIRAVFTLGGVSLDIGGSVGLQVEEHDAFGGPGDLLYSSARTKFYDYFTGDPAGHSYHHSAYQRVTTRVRSNVNDLTDADVETAPGSYVVQADDLGTGTFEDFAAFHAVSENVQEITYRARAELKVTSVNLAPSSPGVVPEPGAWALMIVGFGAAGAALRQRRARALA